LQQLEQQAAEADQDQDQDQEVGRLHTEASNQQEIQAQALAELNPKRVLFQITLRIKSLGLTLQRNGYRIVEVSSTYYTHTWRACERVTWRIC
jgi:hypothetical protein